MLIAVISDTHSTLHPRLITTLREARPELILHAGDVGSYLLLEKLTVIAPVRAVRGNVDLSGRVSDLPDDYRRILDGVDVYMTHVGGKPEEWLPRLPDPRPQVAICGHSHIPLVQERGGVLFINPGSAGTMPRFGGSLSFALLSVEEGVVRAELVILQERR